MKYEINIILIVLIALLFLMFSNPKVAIALEEILQEQFESIDSDEVSSFLNQINLQHKDFLPALDLRDLVGALRTEKGYDIKGLMLGVINYFMREITANYKLLAQLISLTMVCALLNNIQSAFENDNIALVTRSIVYLILITIVIQSFNTAINVGKEAIEQMVSFIQALLPVILTILASLGNITSVAVFKPLIFIGITIASTWIKNLLLPLIFFIAVLSLVSNISERFHVSMLTSLLKQITVFLLGFFMSVFLGIIVVQGAGAATIDGISVRTAKFATKNFIPIVGGFFSDTVDAVMGCSLILKNSVGVVGLIVVFILTIFPVVKILSLVFIYKIAGAIIQPMGEEHIVKCLNEIGSCLTLVLISVSSVALMFFIAITIIIAAGNISVMMR